MLADLLSELSRNEAVISALVGLLTLGTAAWGIMLLAFSQRRPARAAGDEAIQDSGSSHGRNPWLEILDRGLSEHSELDQVIAVRTTNVSLLCIMGFTLGWVFTGMVSEDYVAFAIINMVAFLVALAAFLLHATRYGKLSRWLLLCGVLAQWTTVLLCVGRQWGIEYLVAGILLLPPLLFTRSEQRQQAIALGICIAALPLALWLESMTDLRVEMSENFMTVAYYANAGALGAVVALVLNFYNNAAVNSFHELEDQKAKSDALVRSILPDYVAARLAEDESTVADWHQEASVLFATVYGFQDLARRVSAVQLVELLSQIFLEFDQLVEREGVEKVNTLGANYVVATGIGENNLSDHAALARVAIGMRDIVSRISDSVNHPFSLRVGLSTGQVVSGVIGEARPSFDIWGETVELANSLRGTAVDNSVVVNEACYWRLRDWFDFEAMAGEERRFLLCDEKTP